jgi:quinoprotein glucose dehydrogenase
VEPALRLLSVLLLAIFGLALGIGGLWLVSLGGSAYYVIAGIALLCAAFLTFRGSGLARWLYAAIVLATLGWALWEVGLDWWPLATRGGLVVLLGLWLLLPWALLTPRGRTPLAAALIIAIVAAGVSLFMDRHRIEGRLPEERLAAANTGNVPAGEWHQYGRTLLGQRYSPLDQINVENVGKLDVAWTYRTGDIRGPGDVPETTYQVTPLKVGDLLYVCTPHNLVIALDAATGQERWKFDPKVPPENQRQHQTCRGVSYYAAPDAASGAPCSQRIYMPTADARLIALDALKGTVCPAFGEQGTVNLWTNMPNRKSGYYYSTSPPVVAAGLIIVGGAVNDNYAMASPSGVIRAYNVDTGALVWNWDSGNPDRTEPLGPGETFTANSPNSWSISSADEELGMIYVPLGNRTPDQLGMDRSPAVERFSSSVVALDLRTGQVRWVFQTVHHDLWDMDVPAQPSLIDLQMENGVVPALVQPTKQGDIYVLDRRTGQPILPVTEKPAPGGAIEGDHTSPTQPLSALTFRPPPLQEKDMWGVSLLDQLACRIKFRSLRYEGQYTPPSLQGTIVYPGNFGTFNWGGIAVDPVRQIMFGMPTYVAFTSTLIPSDEIGPNAKVNVGEAGLNMNIGGKYGVIMGPFLSPIGLPCQAPPWGYVAGVDLRTGKIAWKHKNGTIQDAAPLPIPLKIGVPGIGGPIITAGGVAFLSATIDNYLRAYNVTTGEQIWEQRLPAGGQATPMTYMQNGRQYVVHVAGGHGSVGTKAGDYVIAYALPRNQENTPAAR